MANWCRGHLKIRGKCKNIEKFLTKEFIVKSGEIINETSSYLKLCSNSFFVMKNNHNHGVYCKEIVFYNDDYENKEEDIVYVLEDFFALNKIDTKSLKTLSKKYNLDFKIKGFEQYMEIVQDIEVERGKITLNTTTHVANYAWNVLTPMSNNFGY